MCHASRKKSSIHHHGSPKGGPVVILQLSFAPAGIAVDSARGRVYLSNQQGSQVLVYSTKGALLHTIQVITPEYAPILIQSKLSKENFSAGKVDRGMSDQ